MGVRWTPATAPQPSQLLDGGVVRKPPSFAGKPPTSPRSNPTANRAPGRPRGRLLPRAPSPTPRRPAARSPRPSRARRGSGFALFGRFAYLPPRVKKISSLLLPPKAATERPGPRAQLAPSALQPGRRQQRRRRRLRRRGRGCGGEGGGLAGRLLLPARTARSPDRRGATGPRRRPAPRIRLGSAAWWVPAPPGLARPRPGSGWGGSRRPLTWRRGGGGSGGGGGGGGGEEVAAGLWRSRPRSWPGPRPEYFVAVLLVVLVGRLHLLLPVALFFLLVFLLRHHTISSSSSSSSLRGEAILWLWPPHHPPPTAPPASPTVTTSLLLPPPLLGGGVPVLLLTASPAPQTPSHPPKPPSGPLSDEGAKPP